MTVAVVLMAMVGIVDHALLTSSYSYRCWRVAHPYGPSVKRFQHVIHTTTVNDIPMLIDRMDREDAWWVDELLQAWFGQPTEVLNADPSKQAAWKSWWRENKSNVSELRLVTDPQF